MAIGSLLLHGGIIALLLFVHRAPPALSPEAESSFELVMQGGAPNPATPGAAQAPPAATPGAQSPLDGPPVPPAAEPSPPPPQAPPAPTPPAPVEIPPAPVPETAPPEPSPPPVPQIEPTPPAPAPPTPAPPAPAPPAAAPPTPPPPAPEPQTPAEPPRVELFTPDAPAPPPPVPIPMPLPPSPPRPRAPQIARPVPRPAPRNPSGFPAPQDWSLGGGLPAHPSQQGTSGPMQLAGPSVPTPHITGAELGRDWIAAYTAWVQAHLYYPEQAALNGEDGTTEAVIHIDRYGKVLSVELVTRSGSQWLDLETTGMFRGAHVPPFPQGTKDDTATIDQTIHYILRRR